MAAGDVGSSTLGVYNPIFYAQEALLHLEKALGMASRVHRGFDAERKSFGKGDTVNIRRPQTFSVANAPATAAGVITDTVAITLDQWKEVKFAVTDQELAYSGQRIIDDHIRPAAYALADNIDTALVALHKDVGNRATVFNTAASKAATNITNVRQKLVDQACPLDDLHLMIDSTVESAFLQDSAFSQWQGAGDAGVSTQQRGTLGTKFGMEVFMNQNVPTMTGGTGADLAGAVDGAHAKGVSSITIDNLNNGETFLAGDSFTIAGDTTPYALTTATSTVSGAEITASITPNLKVAMAGGEVVTFSATDDAAGVQLGFHRNAFALCMAPLPELGNELGARVATVSDPVTGLSVRSRVYYVGDSSQVHIALDTLYGVATLDGRMAVKQYRA